MHQPTVDVSGWVYLKEKGEEAYTSSAAPNCPRACHDSQTENRRRGEKKKKKKFTPASVCHSTHTTLFLQHHNNTAHSRVNAACLTRQRLACSATCNALYDQKMAVAPSNYSVGTP